MTRDDWQRDTLEAKRLWDSGNEQEALARLDALVQRLDTEHSRDVEEWERGQTMGLKAALLMENPRRQSEASAAYMEQATALRGQLRGYGKAVGFALANAALCMFREGREVEAFQAGEDALALLGLHGDTSGTFEQLTARLRQFHEERAGRKEPSPSRRW